MNFLIGLRSPYCSQLIIRNTGNETCLHNPTAFTLATGGKIFIRLSVNNIKTSVNAASKFKLNSHAHVYFPAFAELLYCLSNEN